MGLNLFQAFQNFMSGAQQQYGPGFDPSTVCKNMLGNNCATPQQALQKLLQDGKISQAQYDQFLRMPTLNGGHNAILQQMGNYEMARQQCCCENKAAIADLKYTVATENCADRTALDTAVWNLSKQMSDGFQSIKDQLYQNKLDEKNDQILNLQRQLDQRDRAASQVAQNQFFAANNQMQTDTIMNFLNPPYARTFPPTTTATANG